MMQCTEIGVMTRAEKMRVVDSSKMIMRVVDSSKVIMRVVDCSEDEMRVVDSI